MTAATEPELRGPGSFDFVVTGCGRGTLAGMPFPRIMRAMFDEWALLRPSFALYTGDSLWGYDGSRQEMLNDFDRFRSLADTLEVPLYNAPGNHEMQSNPDAVALLVDQGQDLYGSFDVAGWHVVALNTDEVCLEGRVAEAQLDWLRRDLEEHRGADGMLVFMHRPLFSWFQGDFNPDDAEVLQDLFRTYGVRAVFAAHDHFFHREDHDDIAYFTLGGGGGPMYTQPSSGGFAHYLHVAVSPEGIEYNVIEPGHIDLDYVAGNDGVEPLTMARIGNTTDRDLVVRRLRMRVPRLADESDYRISVEYIDWERNRPHVETRLREVRDMRDGSVELSIELPLEAGAALRVSAEARP